MIDLKFSMDGITVETKLEDRLCLLRDKSGKGKTFLFRKVKRYGEAIHRPYLFHDSEEDIESLILRLPALPEDAIVMIDDGIVYTESLIRAIEDSVAYIICDVKSYGEYPAKYRKTYGRYVLDVGSKYVKLRRIGSENII